MEDGEGAEKLLLHGLRAECAEPHDAHIRSMSGKTCKGVQASFRIHLTEPSSASRESLSHIGGRYQEADKGASRSGQCREEKIKNRGRGLTNDTRRASKTIKEGCDRGRGS